MQEALDWEGGKAENGHGNKCESKIWPLLTVSQTSYSVRVKQLN
jgi:hypothetical protein